MGYFSWKCAVSGQSILIASSPEGPTPCVVVCPSGQTIHESNYEGYGVFGGQDIYELLAQWNGYGKDRDLGIDLDSGDLVPIYVDFGDLAPSCGNPLKPIKIVAAEHYRSQKYDALPASEHCPNQGLFTSPSDNDTSEAISVNQTIAWHGTNRPFGQFTSEHIGTGAKAQSYGRGLYFSSKREVAENHLKACVAHQSDIPEIRIYGAPVVSQTCNLANELRVILRQVINHGQTFEQARDLAVEKLQATRSPSHLDDAKFLQTLKEGDVEQRQAERQDEGGLLYQVNLTPQPDEYLLWDFALYEQSKKVQEAIFELFGDEPVPTQYSGLIERQFATGKEIYQAHASEFGAEKASADLHAVGIRGIKYLDSSSRDCMARQEAARSLSHASIKLKTGLSPEQRQFYERMRTQSQEEVEALSDYNFVVFNEADIELISTCSPEDHVEFEEEEAAFGPR